VLRISSTRSSAHGSSSEALGAPFADRLVANGSLEAVSPPRGTGAAAQGAPRRATQGGLRCTQVGRPPAPSWPCIVHRIAHRTAPPPAAGASRCMAWAACCILVASVQYSWILSRGLDPDSGLTRVYVCPSGNPARVGIQTQIEKKKKHWIPTRAGSPLGFNTRASSPATVLSQPLSHTCGPTSPS
jgi:hypothetical protein